MVTVKDILERDELLAKLCCCGRVDTAKYWKKYNQFYHMDINELKELDNDELWLIWNANNGT